MRLSLIHFIELPPVLMVDSIKLKFKCFQVYASFQRLRTMAKILHFTRKSFITLTPACPRVISNYCTLAGRLFALTLLYCKQSLKNRLLVYHESDKIKIH